MRRGWPAGALLVVCASACSSSAPPKPAVSHLATADLVCADFVGTAAPDHGMQVIDGVIGLPSTRVPALQASLTGDSGATRLFSKNGLLVRAGADITLTVADPDHQSIAWGKPGTTTKRLVIRGCHTPAGDRWIAFAGGYFVDRPGCISVIVAHGAFTKAVKIGAGAPCSGQQPPGQPTDT
jgi:hypothetical protein